MRKIHHRLRPSARDFLGLALFFLIALWFLTAGAHDVYRTGARLYKLSHQGEKYQLAHGTVVQVEKPWFGLSVSKGASRWYRVHYHFKTSEGQIEEGGDCIYRDGRPSQSIRIAYVPGDPASNRIYTSNGIYDENEHWGQGVMGSLFVVAGGFFLVFWFNALKMLFE